MVEHVPFKHLAVGSIPTRLTSLRSSAVRQAGLPNLAQALNACLAVVMEVTAETGSTSSRALAIRQRWSVVEIVEHLTRAYSGTAKGFERCLEKGVPLATRHDHQAAAAAVRADQARLCSRRPPGAEAHHPDR